MTAKAIGQSMVPHKGLGGTTHILKKITVAASIGEFLQLCKMDLTFHNRTLGGGFRRLVIQRGHDATPIEVSFGSLQGLLAPHARYSVLEDGVWKSKKFEEMKCRKKGPLTFGRVELFGQTCQICYSEATDMKKHKEENHQHTASCLCMPTILERGSASCINTAIERGLPPLSTESITGSQPEVDYARRNSR